MVEWEGAEEMESPHSVVEMLHLMLICYLEVPNSVRSFKLVLTLFEIFHLFYKHAATAQYLFSKETVRKTENLKQPVHSKDQQTPTKSRERK